MRFMQACKWPVWPRPSLSCARSGLWNQRLMVWSTVNRISSGGAVIGPEQRIEPMQALRAVTIDAAWQVFEEDNRGSLEPGKWADLVILSGDPLGEPLGIRDIDVLETVVGGRTIFPAQH